MNKFAIMAASLILAAAPAFAVDDVDVDIDDSFNTENTVVSKTETEVNTLAVNKEDNDVITTSDNDVITKTDVDTTTKTTVNDNDNNGNTLNTAIGSGNTDSSTKTVTKNDNDTLNTAIGSGNDDHSNDNDTTNTAIGSGNTKTITKTTTNNDNDTTNTAVITKSDNDVVTTTISSDNDNIGSFNSKTINSYKVVSKTDLSQVSTGNAITSIATAGYKADGAFAAASTGNIAGSTNSFDGVGLISNNTGNGANVAGSQNIGALVK